MALKRQPAQARQAPAPHPLPMPKVFQGHPMIPLPLQSQIDTPGNDNSKAVPLPICSAMKQLSLRKKEGCNSGALFQIDIENGHRKIV